MKLFTVGILVVVALLNAGCVTEGVVRAEPAPEEEQVEVNLALGIGYLQEERPDLAIEALLRANDIAPRNADVHSVLALAYDQNGEIELAEEHHARAAQLAPRDPGVQDRYAVFLCLQNRWQDAEPYYNRAIDSAANNIRALIHINAANCARGAEDLAAAESHYRGALDIDPVSIDALRGMIDISIRNSEYLPARAFYQRLERGSQLQAEDLYSCYVIERQLNSDAAADDCADRLQREFPGSPVLRQLQNFEADGG